ncbi:MAG: cyclase family protein [Pirellulales bacterium]
MSTQKRTIVDLSHPLSEQTPAFPGDPPPQITVLDATGRPSTAGERHLNSSHLAIGVHCGTHMDAPFHFFGEGTTIDRVPLDRCVGPAALVRLPYREFGLSIEAAHLAPHAERIRTAGRVIINTAWHHRWGQNDYFTEHPVITGAAARLLVECGAVLVGVDTPSVDRPPYEAHLAILGGGLLILENLTNLDAVPGDTFELVATPLAIVGRDGSPVRAMAIV